MANGTLRRRHGVTRSLRRCPDLLSQPCEQQIGREMAYAQRSGGFARVRISLARVVGLSSLAAVYPLMKNVGVIVVAVAVLSAAAERQWQTGTCVDVGVKHDARVGGGTADFGPFTRQRIPRGTLPEVSTYVIETD